MDGAKTTRPDADARALWREEAEHWLESPGIMMPGTNQLNGRAEREQRILALLDALEQPTAGAAGLDVAPTRAATVADEMAWEALPQDVRAMAERVVGTRHYDAGFQAGKDDGYASGVKDGFTDGYAQAQRDAKHIKS